MLRFFSAPWGRVRPCFSDLPGLTLLTLLHPLRATLCAALLIAAAPAQAETETVVIPASEGYGISDCFVAKAACGKAISDAFCQSRGFGHASAYGLASDITASTPIQSAALRTGRDDLVIACTR